MLALAALLGAPSLSLPQEHDRQREALRFSQAAIGRQVQSRLFTDEFGNAFELSTFFGRPTVISLVYTSCYHTCPMITERLANTVDVGAAALGAGSFNVATIGFDTVNDTPERMRAYARERHIDDPDWRFLSGDAAAVEGLTRDLGFTFTAIGGGFDHLAQITILDAKGRVHAQIYGSDFRPNAIVEPLRELKLGTAAAGGGIGSLLERIRLFCTVYDPASERYSFDYSLLTAILTGILSLGAVAAFIVSAWRRAPAGPGRRGSAGDLRG